MKFVNLKLALCTVASAALLFSCEPYGITEDETLLSNDVTVDNSLLSMNLVEGYCGTPKTVDFWAGQHIDAGNVAIYNDSQYLYVTVETTWGFQNTSENLKMWVGTDLNLLPTSGGGAPINGQFPYKATVANGEVSYTFQILLSDIATYDANVCGVQEIFVVLHGDVLADDGSGSVSGQTAYAGELPGTGNRWWYYTNYTPACCVSTPPPATGHLETAFVKFAKSGAFGTGYVFTTNKKSNPENYASLKLTQNRWGWAGNVTADGSYTFDIYAGAGLNKISNGTLVGSATITKSGTSVSVSYNMASGYSMQEIHIYAGDFAPTTIAPGQYGYIQYFGDNAADYVTSHSASFDVADTNGDGVWIIAHAVSFGN